MSLPLKSERWGPRSSLEKITIRECNTPKSRLLGLPVEFRASWRREAGAIWEGGQELTRWRGEKGLDGAGVGVPILIVKMWGAPGPWHLCL